MYICVCIYIGDKYIYVYIVTFHRPGLRLWGGETFEAAGRFMHQNVRLVHFSPADACGRMLTYADVCCYAPKRAPRRLLSC